MEQSVMRIKLCFSFVLAVFALSACSKESAELLPCMCDASAYETESPGLFDCMCETKRNRPVRKISYVQDKQKVRYQSLIVGEEVQTAYTVLHKSRDSYAPVKLENVDFRIKKSRKYDDYENKLGDYRFRLFGCRRESKNAYLNQGRTVQKDMHFFDVFYETLNDFYPVVVEKSNVYYPDSDKLPYPEYLITAEITDYFMNICDEFDWEIAKNKRLRSGTSEMTVVWRVMNLTKDTVYCRGTTTGYGQVLEGEPNGENLLIERAFEDALVKLPEISCLNSTLIQRIRPEDIARQIAVLQKNETCDTCFEEQYQQELSQIETMQTCDMQTDSSLKIKVDGVPVKYIPVSYIEKEQDFGSRDMSIIDWEEQCTEIIDAIETSNDIAKNKNVTLEFSGVDFKNFRNLPCWEEIQATAQIRDKNLVISEDCTEIKDVQEEIPLIVAQENISISDDFFVDIPLELDLLQEDGGTTGSGQELEIDAVSEKAFATVNNRFCIMNNPPFENLDPHNLYRLRSSIVSVSNSKGNKGAGLIIADNLVLTSADLIVKDNNIYNLQTINGKKFKASAFRVNPNKNVAVLLLDKPTEFQPLPMELKLPEVNKDILMTLGMLDFEEDGENYIDNEGRVVGYRWSENKGAEIIVDTFVQTVALGGALIDQKGNIVGIAHKTKKDDQLPDLFIPIETALKSLGLEICGQIPAPVKDKPKAVRVYTPIAEAIDNSGDKKPVPTQSLKRK